MSSLDDYRRFVADMSAASAFASWKRQNPKEYTSWAAFDKAVSAGQQPAPPTLKTKFGMGLVDAALIHLNLPAAAGGEAPFFVKDFRDGDLSGLDLHDANVGSGGSVVASGVCRLVASDSYPSSSTSGAATVLWAPGEYGNAWCQRGQTTWFRAVFLLPDGRDPSWPGRFVPAAGDGLASSWHTLMEWHHDDQALIAHGGRAAPSSPMLEIGWNPSLGYGPALLYRPLGGLGGSWQAWYLYETDVTQQASDSATSGGPRGTVQPLRFNHWYDVLYRFGFDETIYVRVLAAGPSRESVGA